MLQNKCNNNCNTAEVVNDLVAAVDKLEAKVFKLFIELDKLKEIVEQQQATIAGPLMMFEEVAQNERHIETLADEIIRDKLDKAIDEISDKLKDAILDKIRKQSMLW